ncbi:hypothetical protein [Streptomyces sp. 1222.5]|uniref:hypothetical protein n=1 Tax=Streptomyces sp. 1222.5 TaxID=1881026 RepID=UPI003EBA88F6
MSASERGSADAARRARVLRLETLRDLEGLVGELQELHSELAICEDSDGDRLRTLLHSAGVMTGVFLDDVACRFVGSDRQADDLFALAWRFLEELSPEPLGFRSAEDSELFRRLRDSAASMLARLWITGFLLGPVPEDGWPNQELVILLLRALEQHADALALAEALDRHLGQKSKDSPRNTEASGDLNPGNEGDEP